MICSFVDFGQHQHQKSELKIKPRKGRPTVKSSAPEVLEDDDDISGFLHSRSLGREALEELSELGQDASPPLKPKRQQMLSCLSHAEGCSCPCCSDPSLARVSILWALTQAEVQNESHKSQRLRHLAKLRCRTVSAKLLTHLSALVPDSCPQTPSMLQTEVARGHLNAVLMLLHYGAGEKGKATALWDEIEAGLMAVEPRGVLFPELGPLKAALLGAKAVACCLALAGKKQCSSDKLFSSVWGWTPSDPQIKTPLNKHRAKQTRTTSSSSDRSIPAQNLQQSKKETSVELGVKKTTEGPGASVKKSKNTLPKICITKSSLMFKTPRATRTPRPKSVTLVTPADPANDLSPFDFTTEVPDITVSSTPLPAVKALPGSSAGTAKAKDAPKGSFQVFEDSSPLQEKPVPVPAAPKRTKRSRFKV